MINNRIKKLAVIAGYAIYFIKNRQFLPGAFREKSSSIFFLSVIIFLLVNEILTLLSELSRETTS